MKLRMTWEYWCVFFAIAVVYYVPSGYLTSIGIPIDSLIFGGWLLFSFILLIKRNTKFTLIEFLYIMCIFILCMFQLSISPLILLTPVLIKHFLSNNSIIIFNRILNETYIFIVAVLFTIIYSVYYGISSGRFLHTGVDEVNESGLAIFLLALIIKKRWPKFGNIILLFGVLSLSRNYLFALIFYALWNIDVVKKICLKIYNKNIINLGVILPLAVFVLYLMGLFCETQYIEGKIFYEIAFKDRIKNFLDLSNYYRFTGVVYLVNIFLSTPKYLFFGCKESIFKTECYKYASEHGQLYVGNNPHNLLLSYTKIYGITGCFYISFVSSFIRKYISRNNLFIYIILLSYAIFLGASFNGYWLIISLFTLALYT